MGSGSDNGGAGGFLAEGGRPSSMRLMAVLCAATACAVTLLAVAGSVRGVAIDSNVPWLVGSLLAAAMGGKVGQKVVEARR